MIQTYGPLQNDIYLRHQGRCDLNGRGGANTHYLLLSELHLRLSLNMGAAEYDTNCYMSVCTLQGDYAMEQVQGYTIHDYAGNVLDTIESLQQRKFPSAGIINGFEIRDTNGKALKGEWVIVKFGSLVIK